MKNQAVVSGTVKELVTRETTQGKQELYVILEEQNGKYTDTVAIKCWRDTVKAQAELLRPGQLAEASGRVRSREWKGRYYTDFEADHVKMLGTPTKHREESVDPADDELAF